MQENIIAMDGPAGAGKSTIAKLVAERLHFTYIDTGAMYRALTLKALQSDQQANLFDTARIVALANATVIDFVDNQIILDGVLVEPLIRNNKVSRYASQVAAIPEVRRIMVDKQRQIAQGKNVVMDGRDVGTIIFPDAWLKFYITASAEVRAKRRYKQLYPGDSEADAAVLAQIQADIEKRDYADMHRQASPLKIADQAIVIDTSFKTINAVIEEIVDKICAYGGPKKCSTT